MFFDLRFSRQFRRKRNSLRVNVFRIATFFADRFPVIFSSTPLHLFNFIIMIWYLGTWSLISFRFWVSLHSFSGVLASRSQHFTGIDVALWSYGFSRSRGIPGYRFLPCPVKPWSVRTSGPLGLAPRSMFIGFALTLFVYKLPFLLYL